MNGTDPNVVRPRDWHIFGLSYTDVSVLFSRDQSKTMHYNANIIYSLDSHTAFLRGNQQFFTRIYPPKFWCGLCKEYYVLLTTEPATPVLYFVKLPVETASVWDCYLASYYTRANALTYYRYIGTTPSIIDRFPEVGRLWYHWKITENAASDNQSAANAIANISLSHR
jgi:hypothetical protein